MNTEYPQGRKPIERQEWKRVTVHLSQDSAATKAAEELAKKEGFSVGKALRVLLERLLG